MTSRINCNRTSECPKGNTVGSRDIELNFIFFGCWGVYCKDGPNVIYEPSVDQYDREAIRNDEIAFKEKLNRPDININVGMYDEFWMEQQKIFEFWMEQQEILEDHGLLQQYYPDRNLEFLELH